MDAADQGWIIARLALAAALGAAVGAERELRGYPAGLRTLALVALGAALFTEASRQIGSTDRIAAGVVTGIGFIGAGVIFRQGPRDVRGITTAATIWAVAAIGLAVALELYIVAPVVAAVVLVLLELRTVTHGTLRWEERRVGREGGPRPPAGTSHPPTGAEDD